MKKLKIQNGGTVKNSPVPASQLPHRKDKNYNVPDVIGNKVKESKKTPYTKSLTSTKVAKGKSGIHIKPENKGKFTATKKATGKSTEELTHSKNPITKKRAIFAQNAKKWKHKAGGKIAGDATKKEDGGKLSKDYIAKAREKAGGSNVGKKTFASGEKRTGPYVGPSGGAPKGSYPVPDLAHAKSAIKLSGHAPNPAGIKEAVYRKFPQLKKKEGGSIGLNEKEGDQAAVYKKGNKVVKGQKGVSGIEDS